MFTLGAGSTGACAQPARGRATPLVAVGVASSGTAGQFIVSNTMTVTEELTATQGEDG